MGRAAALAAVVALVFAAPAWAAPGTSSPCPGDNGDPTQSGWALSTTTFDNAYTRHPYVGNGYLSQRLPATGTGYVETSQQTGWPLFTRARCASGRSGCNFSARSASSLALVRRAGLGSNPIQ